MVSREGILLPLREEQWERFLDVLEEEARAETSGVCDSLHSYSVSARLA